jgi:predicted site-specific integrase-resolvase
MGWYKIKDAAEYAGVSPGTFRSWLKKGLRHSRLPSGMILIKEVSIDEFLEKYEVDKNENNRIDRIVNDVLSKFRE